MVTAPKCKVCGHPHWLNQAHVGMGSSAPDARDVLIADLRRQIADLQPDAEAWRVQRERTRQRVAAKRKVPAK